MSQHATREAQDDRVRSRGKFRHPAVPLIALTMLLLAMPTASPAVAQAQDDPGTGAIEVHVVECLAGFEGPGYYDACHENGIIGADVSIVGPTADTRTTVEAGGPGAVRFEGIPAGSYTVSVNLPDTGQTYSTYCSLEDSDTEIAFSPADSSTGTLELAQGQGIVCDVYVLPAGPVEDDPPAVDEREPDLASLVIDPVACPPGTEAADGFDVLAASCVDAAKNVTFTLGGADGAVGTVNTSEDPGGRVVFGGLVPGTYTVYTDVPLELAVERLFCTADEGPWLPKTLSDTGIATFGDVTGENLRCAWFIVPFESRGEPGAAPDDGTTSSLVVHLAVCPQAYEGSAFYDDCHDNGLADQEFSLTGAAIEASAVTTVPMEPGPGIAEFTGLPAGSYTLAGGPPGDVGSVRLFCSLQPRGAPVDTWVASNRATVDLGDGENILCDWYYIPVDSVGDIPPTPDVTPEPAARAEIIVTLLACPPGETMAGATRTDLVNACAEPRDDVSFTLGDSAAPPLAADTGVSGPGTVRFHDLLPADYSLTSSLPSGLASTAVFCQLDGGDAYQKSLANGETSFVDVNGESIACQWFVTQPPPAEPRPQGSSGAITVREFLCQTDASKVRDWEQDCKAGSSGTTFTVDSGDGANSMPSATNENGVASFTGLPDGFYPLKQHDGTWCRAKAERVDSSSRVIVENGQNTTVYIYQCSQVTDLPATGSGPVIDLLDDTGWWSAATPIQQGLMGAGVLGLVILISRTGRSMRNATGAV